MVIKMPVK